MSILPLLTFVQTAHITMARWIDAFWGYDVFIAHRRSDAAQYATAIFAQLTSERISAFIDKEVYGPGDSLFVATRRHVAKSSLFLLVGSPDLLAPRKPVDWVEREIDTYLTSHAADPKLILIDFGGTISNALNSQSVDPKATKPILSQLAPFLHIREDMPALLQSPSEQVLDAVRRNLKGRRRDRNRLRFFEGVAALLALLLLVAVVLGVNAWWQKNIATQESARARANEYATKARSLIGNSPRAAVLTAVEASRQTTTGVVEPISQEVLSTAVSRLRGVPLPGNGSFRDELSWVQSIALSEDGRRAAVGDRNGSVYLWDVAERSTPSRVRVLPPIYNGWQRFAGVSPAPVTNVGLSRNGRWVAIATRKRDGEKQSMRIVDTTDIQHTDGLQITPSDEFAEIVTLTSSLSLLLSANRSEISLLDLDAQSDIFTPRLLYRSDRPLLAMTATADGRQVASIDNRGHLVICSIDEAVIVKAVTIPALASLPSAWEDQTAFKKAFKVSSLRLSPNARFVALLAKLPSERVQAQQMAELWDISQQVPTVVASYPSDKSEFGSFDKGDGNLVTEVSFSPDSSLMAIAHNHKVRLWNLSRRSPAEPPEKTIEIPGEYSAMAYSLDSMRLSIGDSQGNVVASALGSLEDKPVRLLNAEDGAGEINELVFSKGGDLLLAGGQRGSAWLMNPDGDIINSGFLHLSPPPLQEGATVQVSEDGSTAAALSKRGLWLASLSDYKTRILPLPMEASADAKQHLHLYASGRRAVVWDEVKSRLHVINLESGIIQATVASVDYPGPALTELTFDTIGDWVVANDHQRRALLLSLRDLGSGQLVVTLKDYEGGGFIFSPRSDWLLSGTARGFSGDAHTPHLWRLTPQAIHQYLLPSAQTNNLEGYQFSADGRWLATSEGYKPEHGKNNVYVWGLDPYAGPDSPFIISDHTMKAGIQFSLDGKWMISFDNLPGMMDTKAGQYLPKALCLWKIPHFDAPAWRRSFQVQSIDASFSLDNSWLSVGTDGSLTATLLDLRNASLSETLEISSGATLAGDWQFTFSGDGRWFSTQGRNAAARLWRFNSAKQPSLVGQNLMGGSGHLAFGPNSRTLAASSDDVTTVFWLSTNDESLRSVAFTAGGEPRYGRDKSHLVLRTSDAVKLIQLEPEKVIAKIATSVGRNLTWTEWQGLFPGRPYTKTFQKLPSDPSIAAEFLERAEAAFGAGANSAAAENYRAASDWAIDSGNPVAANQVAWLGSTHGFAEDVLAAAEFAVKQVPGNGNYRDTRGVARCMLTDLQGALDDFKTYLAWAERLSPGEPSLAQRREWVAAIKAGKLGKGLCKAAL